MLTQIKKFFQTDGLAARTRLAAVWTFAGRGVGSVIRLASNLVLTRLLYPEAFGIIATSSVVLGMVQIFSDTGVRTALIQNNRSGEQNFLDTAWTISILRGFILFALVALGAQPLAQFYSQPELLTVILIMSGTLILEGVQNPAMALVIKKLDAKLQVGYEFTTQLLGFVVTVFLVWKLRSVEAVALGNLAVSAFRLIGSFLVVKECPRLRWDREAGTILLQFGKHIFINSMLSWAAFNFDRLLIGKVLDMEQLGFYNIALYIGTFGQQLLIQVFAQSYFPALSSVAGEESRVQAIFRRTSALVMWSVTPLMVLMAVLAPQIIDLFYDARYQPAALILFWISLRAAVLSISAVQSMTLLALGRPALESIATAAGLMVLLVTLSPAGSIAGMNGVGVSILLTAIVITAMESVMLVRRAGFPAETILRPWKIAGMVIIAPVATHLFLNLVLAGFTSGIAYMIIVLSVALVAGAVVIVRRLRLQFAVGN